MGRITLADLNTIPNSAEPSPGMGLTLDVNGKLPPAVLASPTHLPGMGAVGANLAVVANTAYLMPVPLYVPTTISRISFGLVVVVAGNYDVGVYYSDDEATFLRLVSKGTTAQPAAGNIIASIASTTLVPATNRRWYYALAMSTASTVGGASSGAQPGAIPGYTKATSFPLPASLASVTAIGATPLPALHGAV